MRFPASAASEGKSALEDEDLEGDAVGLEKQNDSGLQHAYGVSQKEFHKIMQHQLHLFVVRQVLYYYRICSLTIEYVLLL